ncbi:TolC family protein [Thalassotalea atypica]|uniref:TolC family protein n=1 Tax=Thalassotalea atypica TaxID=2054316 RepID=UPI002572D0E9|nr:TolC family protein [Thalassotalea atypica]
MPILSSCRIKAKLMPLLAIMTFQVFAAQQVTLEQAITLAQQNDPWSKGNDLKQSAIEARSIASLALADPKVSISATNLPTDNWDFDQEAMTQLKVGVSQMLPRGDVLKIKSAQLTTEAEKFPLLNANRNAQVEKQVTQLWLDAYLAQKTIRLINDDKGLFEQMVDIAKASYSTAVGKTRQQDVIRAQLELLRLDDRLVTEQQKLETAKAGLSEWFYQSNQENSSFYFQDAISNFSVDNTLPHLSLSNGQWLKNNTPSKSELAQLLVNHPVVLAVDVKQKVAKQGVELAQQQYQPQFGVNASYAYRDNAPNGTDRSDFFSVGVTFDLPLFTKNKQDKVVSASMADAEAINTEKLLLVRNMIAEVEKELRNLNRLSQRQTLYKSQLIKQTHEQAEAALTAYTNDDGDFAEVVRARIAQLNTTIAKVNIDVDALKTVSRLNYFLIPSTNNHLASSSELSDVK